MDYWKMYATLCAACSDAIDAIDRGASNDARNLLQKALWDAEDMYITPDVIYLSQQRMGEYHIQDNERLKADPNAAVPESIRKRCLDLIDKAFQE